MYRITGSCSPIRIRLLRSPQGIGCFRLGRSNCRQAADCGYEVKFSDFFRRAASFVDKILKGTKPGDIPIEQATKFKSIVNLKTAKALGFEVPPVLLARADEVIE